MAQYKICHILLRLSIRLFFVFHIQDRKGIALFICFRSSVNLKSHMLVKSFCLWILLIYTDFFDSTVF